MGLQRVGHDWVTNTHTQINKSQKEEKRKSQANITYEHTFKNPHILRNTNKPIQQYIKRIIHHDRAGFNLGFKEFLITTNQSVWYNRSANWRKKSCDHLIRYRKKILTKFNTIYEKSLQKVGIKGIYLNIIKAIHANPSANIILNGEKPGWKHFL